MATSFTPKNRALYDIYRFVEERQQRDPDWAIVASKLRDYIPTQSTMRSERYLPLVERLERGMSVSKACAETDLTYQQVKPVLAEIGWNTHWRWRDMNRKIGLLTLAEIKAAYEAARGDHGIGVILATRANVSRQRIQQVLQALKLTSPYSKKRDHETVIRMLNDGCSIEDVAAVEGINFDAAASLVSRLRRAGVAKPHVPELTRFVEHIRAGNEEPALGS